MVYPAMLRQLRVHTNSLRKSRGFGLYPCSKPCRCINKSPAWGCDLSKVDHDVILWLRTTHQNVVGGGQFEGGGQIIYFAGDEPTFTLVANAGSARPARRYIACFSKFEQAGK